MNLRQLLTSIFLLNLLITYTATAQDAGPERRRRYYSRSARPYYRGPLRLTLGGGAGFYNGDIAGPISNNFPGPSVSAGLLYMVRPQVILGGEFSYFELGAKDKIPERNLAFKGRNGSAVAFLRYELFHDEGEYGNPQSPVSLIKPYIKIGLGALLYNPQAYNGTTRPTRNTSYLPLERNDYPATALVAPVGVGITFRLTPKLNATTEAAYYFTTTDQLDDISPRSGRTISAKKDGYSLLELKLEYAPWRR